MEKHGNPNQPKEVPYAPPKTVGVRDEAGNRYEATYARRAKGLVKNGRARFTDESQTEIILACPPNQKLILEDKIMTEQNTNIQATENQNDVAEKQVPQLTAKEIFDQIVALQNLLAGVCTNPLHSLHQSVTVICETEWDSGQEQEAAIDSVAEVFRMREETYRRMLDIYLQMYNGLESPQKTEQTCDKIQVISHAFKDHANMIRNADADDVDAKFDALRDISERMENLIRSVL